MTASASILLLLAMLKLPLPPAPAQRIRIVITVLTIGVITNALTLMAQVSSPEAPEAAAEPEALMRMPRWSLIIDGGGGYALAAGSLKTTCNCTYENGGGGMLLAGLAVEWRLRPSFALELRAGYVRPDAELTAADARVFYDENGRQVPLAFERRARITLDVLDVSVMARWQVMAEGLYLQGGPVVSALLDSRILETERITTPGYLYPDSQSNLATLADGPLGEVRATNRVFVGVRAGAGWIVPLTASMALAPEIGYLLPLQSMFSGGDSWNLHQAAGSLRLRLAL